jgi:hypothetical protein
MKTWIKNIAFSIGLFALMYLTFSFVSLEINPFKWEMAARALFAFWWVGLSAIVIGYNKE